MVSTRGNNGSHHAKTQSFCRNIPFTCALFTTSQQISPPWGFWWCLRCNTSYQHLSSVFCLDPTTVETTWLPLSSDSVKRAEGPRALYGSIIYYVFLSIRQLLAVSSTEATSVQHIKQSSEDLCCSVFLDAFQDINHVDALQHIGARFETGVVELMWNHFQPVSQMRASFLLNLCPDNRSIRLAASQKSLRTETITCPASSNLSISY